MYTTEDFTEIDKSKFKCFKFQNGNIYYGETTIINEQGEIVTDKEQLKDEELSKTFKEVRHGHGVQLYGVEDSSCKCKYEGSWSFDKKNGRGVAHFPDGSSYEGDFNNDKFEGVGKFIWKSGHVYIGNWKNGKMDGIGEFKHRDGHILHGQYINNYMHDKELNIFINPFLTVEDLEVFYKDNKLNQELLKKQSFQFTPQNIQLVFEVEQLSSLIDNCINSNNTPLLLRTIEKQVNKDELFNFLPKPAVEIDLKYYYLKLRECELISPQIKKVYDEIKSKFTDAFVNGKLLILNFDDCSIDTYDKLFNPSIVELYGNYMFSPKMWQPQTFKEGDNFLEHTHGNKEVKLNPNFKFVVYSKFLIENTEANEEQLMDIIEKKFGKDFPLKYMKIFVLAQAKKVVEEKKPEEPVEEEVKEDDKKKNRKQSAKKK